ncbi:MAG: type II secretion system protein [Clostridiales bacterium]|jgi:prepilin-type N-terminal cleavage/methylation domain-containing protein|nr:type II secretion system protein [Clostridiales bacterium]
MKNNKKGFTLVEVLASVIILALITGSIVFAIAFSQRVVQENSVSDAYAAEVQAAADVIMTYVNGGLTTGYEIEIESQSSLTVYHNAETSFDPSLNDIQFTLKPETGGSGLYEIRVRLYYGPEHNRESIEMVCFAHPNW